MPIDHHAFRVARLGLYMTQRELARATGVAERTIRYIEAGERLNPRVDEMMLLSSYLRLDPSEVLIHPRRGKPWLTKSRYARLL